MKQAGARASQVASRAGLAVLLAVMAAQLRAEGGLPDLPPLQDAAWTFAGLPKQQAPATRFSVVEEQGRSVLRIESKAAYGNWIYRLTSGAAAQGHVQWRWKVERFANGADLLRRQTDDAAVKVCVAFDLPLSAVPFVERQKLRLARMLSGEALPGATLCYVWDRQLPPDTVLPNVHTSRLRWMVLRGPSSALSQWQTERRDLRADFLRAFGQETQQVPPIMAFGVGADADNTGSESLAFVADLRWLP